MHLHAWAYETHLCRAVAGVYREMALVGKSKWGDFVAEIGVKRPLPDVNGKHFGGRAHSGGDLEKHSVRLGYSNCKEMGRTWKSPLRNLDFPSEGA